MKVAVCISGICRGNIDRNLKHLKEHFPYDYYYATWKGREYRDDLGFVYEFEEPKINYHPIKDIDGPPAPKLMTQKKKCLSGEYGASWQSKTQHHTKQILIHDMLLQQIPEEYDMIIRARFDTYTSPNVDFSSYLNQSYKKNIAVGFGTRTSRHKNLNQMVEIAKIYPNGRDESISQDWGWYLMDPLIMHPRNLWDHDRVKQLHENKQLAAAEFGWYQVLSEPYGDSHTSVYGGVQIEKYL
jgi:hypothetical protein